MGISSDVKLTRSEWALVRRKIRNRPRLFSKKFIGMQMEELEKYRATVRQIQIHGKEKAGVVNFGLEVLAAPRVGATVSAYHRRARMIHRGNVLAHHKEFYLIQFERRDLGWEWVRDTEIASHGVPEVILTKHNPQTLPYRSGFVSNEYVQDYGSLPYGTSFGQLIGKFIVMLHKIMPFSAHLTQF